MLVNELYTSVPIGVNGNTGNMAVKGLGGFLCEVAGTVTIADTTGTLIAFTAAANTFYPLPFAPRGGSTMIVTLSGGCKGLLGTC